MTDFGNDGYINVTVNRKSKKKPGFEVEQRSDGFYYITKTPKNCTKISVGDRVLEINGTSSEEFKSEQNANDLVDSLRIDVALPEDEEQEDESGEEYEEVERPPKRHARNRGRNLPPFSPTPMSPTPTSASEGMDPRWSSGNFSNNDQTSSSFIENASIKSATDESWTRDYASKYKPDQRFMISATNTEGDDYDLGVDFVEYKEGEIYVSDVNDGPFYETALDRGDKILAINGKKISEHLCTVDEVFDILYSKPKMTLFILRPRKNDKGYKWVHERDE